jgi:hypothetical protein
LDSEVFSKIEFNCFRFRPVEWLLISASLRRAFYPDSPNPYDKSKATTFSDKDIFIDVAEMFKVLPREKLIESARAEIINTETIIMR